MTPKPKINRATRVRLAFYVRRARMGGVARSRLHSPLWKKLCMRFLTERRLKKTETANFQEWLILRGLGDLK